MCFEKLESLIPGLIILGAVSILALIIYTIIHIAEYFGARHEEAELEKQKMIEAANLKKIKERDFQAPLADLALCEKKLRRIGNSHPELSDKTRMLISKIHDSQSIMVTISHGYDRVCPIVSRCEEKQEAWRQACKTANHIAKLFKEIADIIEFDVAYKSEDFSKHAKLEVSKALAKISELNAELKEAKLGR